LQEMDKDAVNLRDSSGKTAFEYTKPHKEIFAVIQKMPQDAKSLGNSSVKKALGSTQADEEVFAVIQKIPQDIINQIDKDVHRTTEKHQEDNTDTESVSCLGKLSLEN
jgi:hypothetical protein